VLGGFKVRIINKQQRLLLLATLLLFLLMGLFPPWKYADGRFLGFHPAWNPPAAIPDSLAAPTPQAEFLPIQIVPQSLYRSGESEAMTEARLRQPYLDIRRMLAISTALFLGGGMIILLLRDRKQE